MKKIGLLFGRENTFPFELIETINARKPKGIVAEPVLIEKVVQGELTDYAVILDRISQDVPFYRAYLKNAALRGTAVVNNPFWWSADEKFFNNCLATKIGVAVPNTVVLPSNSRPDDTSAESFRNLSMPLAWKTMFEYIGWPAYFKPHSGGGWKHVYKVHNMEEFFYIYNQTGQLVMLLQEEIKFDLYFRCYCLGGDRVRVMPYEPRNPHHERYLKWDSTSAPADIVAKVTEQTMALNQALGYDFNTVEFAVRDGVPYAIDFCNPAPDADRYSVGEANFQWVLENAADMLIDKAKNHKEGLDNLTWGSFVKNAVAKKPLDTIAKAVVKVSAPKAAPKRALTAKKS